MLHLNLASKSAVRRKLLIDAGIQHIQTDSGLDEDVLKERLLRLGAKPIEIAISLGTEKSHSVSRQSNELTLGADQILDLDGKILSKTKTAEEVRHRLELLSGKQHWLHTGVCFCLGPLIVMRAVDSALVTMRRLSSSDIDRICQDAVQLIGTLGGYKSEDSHFKMLANYEGHSTTVLGLPMPLVTSFLRSHAIGV